MNKYMMILQTSTGGISWEYSFYMASDKMALDYARRHTKSFAGVRWFMALLLWRLEPEVLLAEFKLSEDPVVHEQHHAS